MLCFDVIDEIDVIGVSDGIDRIDVIGGIA